MVALSRSNSTAYEPSEYSDAMSEHTPPPSTAELTTVLQDTSTTTNACAIQPGIYQIFNLKTGTALDVSAGDGITVSGYSPHQNDNQKWEVNALGKGFSIRCLSNGRYLTGQNGMLTGARVSVGDYPLSWALELDSNGFSEGIEILWAQANPPLMCDLHNADDEPGTSVHLYPREDWFIAHRLWRFVRCGDQSHSITAQSSGNEKDTTITTTTVTTTTTTVTKVVHF